MDPAKRGLLEQKCQEFEQCLSDWCGKLQILNPTERIEIVVLIHNDIKPVKVNLKLERKQPFHRKITAEEWDDVLRFSWKEREKTFLLKLQSENNPPVVLSDLEKVFPRETHPQMYGRKVYIDVWSMQRSINRVLAARGLRFVFKCVQKYTAGNQESKYALCALE